MTSKYFRGGGDPRVPHLLNETLHIKFEIMTLMECFSEYKSALYLLCCTVSCKLKEEKKSSSSPILVIWYDVIPI